VVLFLRVANCSPMGGVKEHVRDIRKKGILTNTWFPVQEPSSKSQDFDFDITKSVIRAGSKGNIEEEMVMVIMAAITILTR